MVSLATDPPGAEVAFKAYGDLDGQWLSIGTSPLSGVSVPVGLLRWRLTKPGFDPLEARLEVETDADAMGHADEKARPNPVPSQREPLLSIRGLQKRFGAH